MKKINVAELLKDCPSGMELDCTLLEDLEFDGIVDNKYVPIRCRVKNPNGGYYVYNFTKYGCWFNTTFAKCAIFPKGKTTWEGFQRPFKDGDILFVKSVYSWVFVYKESENNEDLYKYVAIQDGHNHAYIVYDSNPLCCKENVSEIRLATEEEKAKLFQAIKDNGYKWNPETKTLEKLVEPKFKVGDRVRHKNNHNVVFTITSIEEDYYACGVATAFWFDDQDDYELVPNKFDITTLKPFDKVLVRETNEDRWLIDFYAFYNEIQEFSCVKGMYEQCIPYEGNEHLFLSFDDCDEYFKTWE